MHAQYMHRARSPSRRSGKASLPSAPVPCDTSCMVRRTQAERDAMTVEIGYALVSGVLVAAATFTGVFLLPALLLQLPGGVENVLVRVGAALGALVFTVRVVHVLRRFPRAAEERRLPPLRSGPTSPGS